MIGVLLATLASLAVAQASIWPEDLDGNLLEDDSNPSFPRQTNKFLDDSSSLLGQNGVNSMAIFPNMSIPGMRRGAKRINLPGRLERRQAVCFSCSFPLGVAISAEWDPLGERLTSPKMLTIFSVQSIFRVESALKMDTF